MTSELVEADAALKHLENTVDQGMEHIERSDVDAPEEVTAEYIQPWDQQPGEEDGHYQLFLHYRDQGPGRQIVRVYEWAQEEGIGRAGKRSVYSYAKTFDWKARAKSWDQNQENQYQLARNVSIREMAERHSDDIAEAINALTVPMQALALRMDEDPKFLEDLSRTDSRKLIDMVNRASRTLPGLMSAERLARGMPTEIIAGQVEHQHMVTMEVDQIANILGVLERAGVLDVPGRALGAGEIVDAEVVEVHSVPADSDGGSERTGDQS